MDHVSLLLVDDEQAILHMLKTVLLKEKFLDIDTVTTGEAALEACNNKTYHCIVLDIMLPGKSGLEICPFLRQVTDAPILFLTAKTTDYDKLTGFAVGGDDYVVKPFNPLEVVARIKSLLNRYLPSKTVVLQQQQNIPSHVNTSSSDLSQGIYDFGRFQVFELAGELRVEGQAVTCPALVFQLLLFFCKHPNRIFTKSELYERVWGSEAISDDNTVMVHIHRIRERIEKDPSNPAFLVNVRGLGYKLIQPSNLSRT
ncbi:MULTISPECIES: response regulator transcription factor [Paenibacillus]|uniref:Response regulator transcription factor n=1 Tax=Paenibacillus cucumis (ex Kampfer et al. 2016) TaxID=1776858 RepID=A0ABS7KEI0_9BACL|nr:response regulator transcription factor [Paenibacillus cucumis (ex Kampfer et al. 2016)]MBY0202491.1 response regulator transcription factor [Paenibacillus cucumis (ex Kampfer et al. 2016)]MDP9701818.1 DNA-binding response OmpR family regulator [Paenibacillus intestini]